MFTFRVTKYDPAHRDRCGAYTRDDWISAGDIGRTFAGVVLTEAEYRRVENAYATAAVAFLREAGVPSLAVAGLENHATVPLPFAEGSPLGPGEVDGVVQRVLRAADRSRPFHALDQDAGRLRPHDALPSWSSLARPQRRSRPLIDTCL